VKLFGGLDQVYFWHRWLAIGSLGLIFLHQTTANDDGEDTEVYDDGYDDDMYVSAINLPQAILDYLNTNYPNIGIDEVEIEDGMYGIELDNGLELYFDLNGNFLSVEYDD
jgi:hypothetical protein